MDHTISFWIINSISKPVNCTELGMMAIKVPIVKHLNHFVYFKKKIKGSKAFCKMSDSGLI